MTDPAPPGPSRLHRHGYLVLGWICVALGVIGVFLPLMPTTVFMIVAALLFARGSPRSRAWLVGHRVFGPPILKWEADGAISRPAKVWSSVAMAATMGLTLWLGPPRYVLAVEAVALVSAALFIWTRPD